MEWSWQFDAWIIVLGVLCACSCALLGNYLVLRKMSLMGDAISHAVLPGLAVAFLVTQSRAGFPMLIGAVVAGVLTALLTELIRGMGKVEEGAAMGVVFSVLFAAGLVIIRQAADHVDLDAECVLHGNMVNVALDAAMDDGIPHAVLNLAIVLLADILFVAVCYKELRICAFDPALATTLGINATMMHYALMIMVAITAVASFEAVGSILVIAMLIAPAATARLLTDRLGVQLGLSQVFALIAALAGYAFAVHGPGWMGFTDVAEFNPAPMIAVVAGAVFTLTLILAPRYGVLSRLMHRAALSAQIVREDILGLLYRWSEMSPRSPAFPRSQLLAAVGDRPAVKSAVRDLVKKGMVRAEGDQMSLSDRGRTAATALIRAHRLWETYLAEHFDIPLDHLHMPAERMEHHIRGELSRQLEDQLPQTDVDPQGKRIPQHPDKD